MENAPPKRVLIVEDDRDIAALLALHLADMQLAPVRAHHGDRALELLAEERFDLVILDLMLPEVSGLELAAFLRRQAHYTPILMLSAKTSEDERVTGLDTGADDYVAKPFGLRELLARVKALLRRNERLSEGQRQAPLTLGDVQLHPASRQVKLRGSPLELTPREFDLLWQFMRTPGRVYTRKQLLDFVWGEGFDGFEHTVNSHINRLRAKLEQDPADPRYILTVWGVGYKFSDATP